MIGIGHAVISPGKALRLLLHLVGTPHSLAARLLWSAQLYLQRKWEEDVGYETRIPPVESEILRMAIKSCVGVWYHLVGGEGSKRCHFCWLFRHKSIQIVSSDALWLVGPASSSFVAVAANPPSPSRLTGSSHLSLERLSLPPQSQNLLRPLEDRQRLPSSALPVVWFLFCFRLPQPVSPLTHQVAACMRVLRATAQGHL